MIGSLLSSLVFLLLAVIIGYRVAKNRKVVATPASGTSNVPASKADWTSLGKGLAKTIKWVLILGFIGWVWYSLENEDSFLAKYVATKSYDHTMPLVLKNLQDQKFCGIEPGKWRFEFPQQEALEQVARHRKMTKAGFYIRTPRGDIEHLSAISNIMVNGTFSGKEKVTVDTDGCVTVSVFTSPEGKTRAEMLGAPIINGVHLVPGRESIPQSFTVLIRFY